MRPLLSLLLSVFLIGGMSAYIQFARSVRRPAVDFQAEFSEAQFEVELERTFDCIGDPLLEVAALEVFFRGDKIYSSGGDLPREEDVRFSIEQGVETGENEISINANREEFGFGAIAVTLYRNDIPIQRITLPSAPDVPTVSGSVVFEGSETTSEQDHE